MRYLLLLALSLLLACDSIDVGEDLELGDAGAAPSDASVSDDGAVDPPGDDDDDDDGVGDPDPIEPDPEDEKPWRYYVDGDECDLVSQNCTYSNETCIRERVSGGFGRAICVNEWGNRHDAMAGWCTHSLVTGYTDCVQGMLCIAHACRVACDPDGDPCPNSGLGSPQYCISTPSYPQPYCSFYE